MIHPSQMNWKPAGFCKIGPVDGITEAQMPEPCRIVRCWRGTDESLWAEELAIPPGKPGLVLSLQMWISANGYISAVIQPPGGRTILLSRHPLLKYTVVELPPEAKPPWLHAPGRKAHERKRCE